MMLMVMMEKSTSAQAQQSLKCQRCSFLCHEQVPRGFCSRYGDAAGVAVHMHMCSMLRTPRSMLHTRARLCQRCARLDKSQPHSRAAMCVQEASYEDIVKVLKSLRSVKGVRLSISSAL